MKSPVARQKLWIDLGGFAVLALLGTAFFFTSVKSWTQQGQANLAQRRQFQLLRQRTGAAGSLVRNLTQQLAAARSALPASSADREDVRRLNSRLSRIAALASKQGLQLRNVEPGKPNAAGDRVVLPIHLTGVADYRGCAEFLHAMRDAFGDTAVDSLRMSAKPDGEKTAVDFEMNLRWYAASSIVSTQN